MPRRQKLMRRGFGAIKVSELENSPGDVGAVPMWYGYAIEAIYVVIGTMLIPVVLGMLFY
jgi:hypothetical protein